MPSPLCFCLFSVFFCVKPSSSQPFPNLIPSPFEEAEVTEQFDFTIPAQLLVSLRSGHHGSDWRLLLMWLLVLFPMCHYSFLFLLLFPHIAPEYVEKSVLFFYVSLRSRLLPLVLGYCPCPTHPHGVMQWRIRRRLRAELESWPQTRNRLPTDGLWGTLPVHVDWNPEGDLKITPQVRLKKKEILSLTCYRSRIWRKAFFKYIINQPLLTNNHSGTELITYVLIDIFRNISMESM